MLPAIVLLLALTGCAGADGAQGSMRDGDVAPGEAPIELSIEAAAERYQGIVCQRNLASDALGDALQTAEAALHSGGTPSLVGVHAAAGEVLRLNRQDIALLRDPAYVWPDSVTELIALRVSSAEKYEPFFEALATAPSVDAALAVTAPSLTAQEQSAVREIRRELGLSPDTTGSCGGYETRNDELYAELERRTGAEAESEGAEAESETAEDVPAPSG